MVTMAKGLLLAVSALLVPVSAALAEAYALAEQDRVRLHAVKWDPDQAVYVPLEAISGEYTVGSDGTLSLPLIGGVVAAGQTTTALAEVVVQELRRQAGFSELPDVGLEVIGHQPVYVLGAVQLPGAYAFRPGLTAQQALALAGGLPRLAASAAGNAVNDTLRLQGDIRTLTEEITRFEAERQRLLAELETMKDDATTADSDAGAPAENPRVDGLEAEILAATLYSRNAKRERIQQLQEVLTEQIERLQAQILLRDEQIEQTKEELNNVRSLSDRGLAPKTRVTGVASSLNDLEAKRLQLEIALLDAQQRLNLAERDVLDLVENARAQGLARLNEVEGQIKTRAIRLETIRALYQQAVAAGLVEPEATEPAFETRFVVTRLAGDAPGTRTLEATGVLRPGDTVEVLRVPADPPADELD